MERCMYFNQQKEVILSFKITKQYLVTRKTPKTGFFVVVIFDNNKTCLLCFFYVVYST